MPCARIGAAFARQNPTIRRCRYSWPTSSRSSSPSVRAGSFASTSSCVVRINELEPEIKALSDTRTRRQDRRVPRAPRQRRGARRLLRSRRSRSTREASIRALGMRHFDVQLIGGMVLNDGMIAEMKTGEGKTLVSTLAGYLNALPGKGVHVVTVNDYLAKRDSEWMGRIYRFLGMDVGIIQSQMDPAQRIPAYRADVTYGTNAEFGFDYLRDNMVVASRGPRAARPRTSPSSTRSTRSSSTRRGPRSSSPAPAPSPPTRTSSSPRSSRACVPTSTSSSTRPSARSPRPRTACASSSASSASTTSTPTRRASWSTTCSSRSRRSSSSSATSTTWSRTARS